ncbi:hypothetical protein JL721_8619 [Aureococcus anophagefferens]|nr:hypothetical protein JL721_8619 [Aureococcus anophagefferens]
MVQLAALYMTGGGVKLDKKKAERLYRTAADRGEAVAQPAWHKEDDAAEAGMENDMNAMLYLETPLEVG